MPAPQLILGQTLAFTADPFATVPAAAAHHDAQGAVLVADGRIAALGPAAELRAAHPQAQVTDMGQALLLPGFVDAHAHFPQTAMIASWGKRLIDWLNSYTFPEEAKFGDPAYAAMIADRYLDLILANGTTSVASFGTVHPESAEAFFTAALSRGMRVWGGKTAMDRNVPDWLSDSAQAAYDDSKRLAEAWHGRGRLSYVITPRFSPTSTPEQLSALGALASERPDLAIQTHLSEQTDEVAWVQELYPAARDYLDTYEAHGLLTPRTLLGHAIHLTPRECARIAEVGAALVHCPTSNTFIGSGLFDMAARQAEGQRVGLATDTGGGSSFSMLRTMAAAYEIGQLTGRPLHPAELLWLATEGSARCLRADDRIGRLAVGFEADIIALDLASTPAIAQRSDRADDIWEAIFPTIMMGDDRAIAGVWVAGQRTGAQA